MKKEKITLTVLHQGKKDTTELFAGDTMLMTHENEEILLTVKKDGKVTMEIRH